MLVGNVSKLTVSPPGYTGATRKGHLVFDACFESGKNLSCFFGVCVWDGGGEGGEGSTVDHKVQLYCRASPLWSQNCSSAQPSSPEQPRRTLKRIILLK